MEWRTKPLSKLRFCKLPKSFETPVRIKPLEPASLSFYDVAPISLALYGVRLPYLDAPVKNIDATKSRRNCLFTFELLSFQKFTFPARGSSDAEIKQNFALRTRVRDEERVGNRCMRERTKQTVLNKRYDFCDAEKRENQGDKRN